MDRIELARLHRGKFAFREMAKVEIEDIIFGNCTDTPVRAINDIINASTEQLAALTDTQRFLHAKRSLQALLQQYVIFPIGKCQLSLDDFIINKR